MAGSGTSDTDYDCYDTGSSKGTESDDEGCFLDYGFQPQIAPSCQLQWKQGIIFMKKEKIKRSPISVAAAVIYMITRLSDDKKPLKDISLATGVAEGTIRNSYKDLYPYAMRLIPSSYAKEEDIKQLCSP